MGASAGEEGRGIMAAMQRGLLKATWSREEPWWPVCLWTVVFVEFMHTGSMCLHAGGPSVRATVVSVCACVSVTTEKRAGNLQGRCSVRGASLCVVHPRSQVSSPLSSLPSWNVEKHTQEMGIIQLWLLEICSGGGPGASGCAQISPAKVDVAPASSLAAERKENRLQNKVFKVFWEQMLQMSRQ